MKRALNLLVGVVVFGPLFLFATAHGESAGRTIVSRTAEIDGVRLHYLTAGHGTPLVLLHGYAETSRMWKPIIPALSERFLVIAPDLPGMGDSDIPADGLDMKSAAIRIHDLVRSLGAQKAEVVGHDIGLMVAYAYAAQFPAEVTKLVLMDAFLPGVDGWNQFTTIPTYGISASTGRPRKPWCRVASALSSSISGMSSPPIRLIRFQKRIARPMQRRMHGRGACMRDGLISFRSCKPPRTSLNSLRPS
jgi:pimeloyl-ACP methyl ester carboxylesterase